MEQADAQPPQMPQQPISQAHPVLVYLDDAEKLYEAYHVVAMEESEEGLFITHMVRQDRGDFSDIWTPYMTFWSHGVWGDVSIERSEGSRWKPNGTAECVPRHKWPFIWYGHANPNFGVRGKRGLEARHSWEKRDDRPVIRRVEPVARIVSKFEGGWSTRVHEITGKEFDKFRAFWKREGHNVREWLDEDADIERTLHAKFEVQYKEKKRRAAEKRAEKRAKKEQSNNE